MTLWVAWEETDRMKMYSIFLREKERHSIDGNPPMGYRSGQMLYYF